MTPTGSHRQSGGRRATVVALGVIATIGVALLVYSLATQVGAPPQPEIRSSAPASDGGAENIPGTDATEPTEQPDLAEQTAPPVTALAESEPTSISISSIGVEEKVFPLGLDETGELLAPSGDQANLAAWFEDSPTPGELGPSVIEGHVTWGGDPSIFFDLGGLGTGDRIDVEREDGTTATFEVYDSARFPKDEFPTLEVYGRTEGPELRLITCGGNLDADGHHLDNTVVFARLVES